MKPPTADELESARAITARAKGTKMTDTPTAEERAEKIAECTLDTEQSGNAFNIALHQIRGAELAAREPLEREVEQLKGKLLAVTAIPTDEQIKKWEAFAQAKISVLNRLAEAVIQDEPASSGWLRQQCGLSADEWHGAGELIAALICFGVDKGFLDWHAAGMADIDMPDQIEAARAEGRRKEREKVLDLIARWEDSEFDGLVAAIRALGEGEG